MAANPNDTQRRDLLQEIELINQRISEANRASATATGQELQRLKDIVEQNRISLGLYQDQLDVLDSIQNKVLKNIQTFDDLDDTLVSITNSLQNNVELQQKFGTILNSTKSVLNDIASIVETAGFDDRQLEHINNASDAYRNMNVSITQAATQLAKGKLGQAEYNELVIESLKSFDELIGLIDTSTQSGRDLVEVFRQGRAEMESFGQAAQRSAAAMAAMDVVLDQLWSSGIPAAGELSSLIRSIGEDSLATKMALIALGAAVGKLAFDYFGAPLKAGIKASNDIKENQIEGAKNVASAQNDLAFAAKQSSLDFSYQLQELTAQFRAASKTAFFGKGLGSVGYAASQLQLAGISAETIATATIAASKAGSGSTKLAADMAIFAERSGVSVDNIANIQQAFKLLDGVSASSALNMAEGTRAMAEQTGLNVGDIMNEVASASEMALSYQIQSGNALARQVVYAKSLGVSFNDVAKAGQSMVLNYKDSIKSEMSLSAMLGRNVDLSEVRAKFMSGDQEGALKALQAQGLNPSDMNMFQQQQLQSALGGMDLNALQKIATSGYQEGVGKVGTLEEKSAKASNDAFLTLKQSAESALQTQQAMIQGQKAVAQAALDTMKNNAWLNSQSYVDYLAAIDKLTIERQFTENIGGVLAASAGGLIGSFLPQIGRGIGNLLPDIGTGIRNLLPQMGGAISKAGKFLTKGGGSALAGIFGGISGFMDKKEKGGTTGEAVGAGALQGGLAVAGAAIGTAFGGPIGTLIGGFLGNTLGGWVNENAPEVSARFGALWDSVSGKFMAIGEKFKPVIDWISQAFSWIGEKISQVFSWLGEKFTAVYDSVNNFMISLGFEEGLGSILSGIATFIGNTLMAPFEILISAFGFLFDIISAVGQFVSGDFTGAWETLKKGFSDFINGVIAPFKSVIDMVYNSFAKLWNGLANSPLGQGLGIGKMELRKTDTASVATVASVAAVVQKPVVAAATKTTTLAEKTNKLSETTNKEMKFSGNVQNEMVALLAANTAILQIIAYNTAGETTVNLDGATVSKRLLSNSRRNYSLARA
jgi:hypothetical protein